MLFPQLVFLKGVFIDKMCKFLKQSNQTIFMVKFLAGGPNNMEFWTHLKRMLHQKQHLLYILTGLLDQNENQFETYQ